jgi:hypothetical protein
MCYRRLRVRDKIYTQRCKKAANNHADMAKQNESNPSRPVPQINKRSTYYTRNKTHRISVHRKDIQAHYEQNQAKNRTCQIFRSHFISFQLRL